MSNQDNSIGGFLVPAEGTDLAPVASANPLVLRGIADLAGLPNVAGSPKKDVDPSRLAVVAKLRATAQAIRRRAVHAEFLRRLQQPPGTARLEQLNAPPDQPGAGVVQPGLQELLDEGE